MQTEPEYYPMWTSAEIQINMAGGPFIIEYKYVKIKDDHVSIP